MPLLFNLRHLQHHGLKLRGELPLAELQLEPLDELIHVTEPVAYELEVEKLEESVLARGRLALPLSCECGRCLKPFTYPLVLADWTCHLPLKGEEKAEVVNDCVDLTPYIREDILLALPQNPLCGRDCGGLSYPQDERRAGPAGESKPVSSAWAELNKLKLK
jgi:uncharacterized protein